VLNVRYGVHKAGSRSSMSVVSKYMSNTGREHWEAIKWFLRYLKGIKNLDIMFERQYEEVCIIGFIDSDHAGDLDKWRSTTSYVFTCGGGPLCWISMIQIHCFDGSYKGSYLA